MKMVGNDLHHTRPKGIFGRVGIVFLFLAVLLTSCAHHRHLHYNDIGLNYEVEYVCKNPKIEVYRSGDTGKKLRGKVKLNTSGILDYFPDAVLKGSFKRGVLNGVDSVFAGGKLREVTTHREGVLHGRQMAFDDSVKVISEFIDGTIHGYQETYIDDQLIKRTFYNHGVRDSTAFYYDGAGNFLTTLQYHHFQHDDWIDQPDIRNFELISFTSSNSLPHDVLRRAEYRGTVMFFSYDPLDVIDASPFDVIHPSVAWNGYCDESDYFGYYYVIDENTCKVCDYIDREDIWIAYIGPHGYYGLAGFEQIEFFSLTKRDY